MLTRLIITCYRFRGKIQCCKWRSLSRVPRERPQAGSRDWRVDKVVLMWTYTSIWENVDFQGLQTCSNVELQRLTLIYLAVPSPCNSFLKFVLSEIDPPPPTPTLFIVEKERSLLMLNVNCLSEGVSLGFEVTFLIRLVFLVMSLRYRIVGLHHKQM